MRVVAIYKDNTFNTIDIDDTTDLHTVAVYRGNKPINFITPVEITSTIKRKLNTYLKSRG
jgi:hypothetical protein